MSNEKLDGLGKRIKEETGITPEEEVGAGAAQDAAKQTIISATQFVPGQMPTELGKESEQRPGGITLVSPYDENELRKAEQLLKEQIKLSEDLYDSSYKSHLLAALIFASQIGIDSSEAVKALKVYINEKEKKLPHLTSGGVSYELASRFVAEYVVRKMAENKSLRAPENFEPSDERKEFMRVLTEGLEEKERRCLAQYVASTQAGFSISSFNPPLSPNLANNKGLRRQNIAAAIAPQSFELDVIKRFLSQERILREILREKFLVAMANPHLREAMPLGALLAGEYRVKLHYSSSKIKEASIEEALIEQIERGYTGSEPKGLLPLEELAGWVVVRNLEDLPKEDLKSRFAQVIPQILEAKNPLVELKKAFPDIELLFGEEEMDRIKKSIEGARQAIDQPDRVPSRDFWSWVLTEPDESYSFFNTVRNTFIQLIYQKDGEEHLQKWRKVTEGFIVSEKQQRNGEPLTLTLFNDYNIGVSGEDGPLFALIKGKDDQWYPTSYWDRKSRRSLFGIEGLPYDKLQQMISTRPFQYQLESDFLKQILRKNLNHLISGVYEQIKSQIDEKTLQEEGVYLSHAASAYRQEGPPKGFQYLIGATPYGVGVYDSIFFALVRHLWQHDKLSSTKLQINVSLTGESITVSHPLLELTQFSLKEIQARLKETEEDVRIPEVTIRKSGGYELRAKAWVYETLLKLKELGFDAVLGKTMAEEFNRQAARIYVESALTDLGFLPEDYQRENPLSVLRDRQQKLYTKSLELGFTIPLKSGFCLERSLSVPLTWEKERQLIRFLEERLKPNELRKFFKKIGINNEYLQKREFVELFLNFASGWGWSQFYRSNEFPIRYSSRYKGLYTTRGSLMFGVAGEYAVSTQAQQEFEVAKKTWEEFLQEIQQGIEDTPFEQKIRAIAELGKSLANEIDKMSQAEVTEWAQKIIKGKMAAVGKDMEKPIEVKTWTDFYEAIKQLMNTARLVLIYRSEKGRFGWEVSTDKEEFS